MSDQQQHSAIRSRIYLGGKFITRDPMPIQISPKRFEKKTTTSNLAMRVDRAFTMAGMPNVRNRREFTLPWSDLRDPAMLEHLDILAAVGQPFGLGLWKQETDVFDGDGVTRTFYMQRRQLLYSPEGVVPDPTFPDFPTRIIKCTGGTGSYLDPSSTKNVYTVQQKSKAEMDAGGDQSGEVWVNLESNLFGNLWTTEFRFPAGDAPAATTDNVVAVYLPLYQVVIDTEQPRSYAQSLVEPRTLKMVEFG